MNTIFASKLIKLMLLKYGSRVNADYYENIIIIEHHIGWYHECAFVE